MSVLRSRPALRWLVPSAAAIVVIGGGAAAGTIVANAEPGLPERSAAQLLVDLQGAEIDGLSGTVVQSSDLGLPGIAGLLGNVQGSGSGGLTSLISGSNTARVWYAGEQKARFALLGTSGETDVIRNGTDVWVWESSANTGTHFKLPAGKAGDKQEAPASEVPTTPQAAADAALAAIDPTTAVTTTGAAQVAGRDAYELVLSPKDTDSLVGQVRLAIDAQEHIPLRVDVYAKNTTKPAFRVAFEQISFDVPADEQFTFNPPPGAKVEEGTAPAAALEHQGKPDSAEAEKALTEARKGGDGLKVVGEGWTTILVTEGGPSKAELEKVTGDAKSESGEGADAAKMAEDFLGTFQKVSGSWGTGRLLSGSLFTVLLTDDGRVLAGAVTPEALYKAAA
ncbi:LolA family protein [Actinoplanes derwentensis]|uniref:Outer membrane lipoprotein-sorting protein n=1 Tax=Actinoplanes derwentensis TaxID=113562 RepID=A0A1H1ZY05_9ACTN|nr:sigma-E factor regulatory protein RseB domain-containing protein [Actinoplanes derwentensis]SDT38628.1 Outer membrane lipoprotein-sorting protein [Actinoplanes derwentensis]